MPPREPSGPTSDKPKWQDEGSGNESEPLEDDQVKEEGDSNLVFLNPGES